MRCLDEGNTLYIYWLSKCRQDTGGAELAVFSIVMLWASQIELRAMSESSGRQGARECSKIKRDCEAAGELIKLRNRQLDACRMEGRYDCLNW